MPDLLDLKNVSDRVTLPMKSMTKNVGDSVILDEKPMEIATSN